MVFFLSSYKGFKKSFFKNGNLTFRLFWEPLQPKIAQAKVLIAPLPTCPYVIFWIGKMLNISFNKCSEAKWSQQAWHLHSLFNHDFASLFQMKIDSLSMRGKKCLCFFFFFLPFCVHLFCFKSTISFLISNFFHFSFFTITYHGSNGQRRIRKRIWQIIALKYLWDKVRRQRIKLAWDL